MFQRSSSPSDVPGNIESIERETSSNANANAKRKATATCSLRDVPRLTREMLMQNPKSKSLRDAQETAVNAARALYLLCDVGHKFNREPMVASGQYDVIGPLTQCLLHEPIYTSNSSGSSSSGSKEGTRTMTNSDAIATEAQQQPRIADDSENDNDYRNDNNYRNDNDNSNGNDRNTNDNDTDINDKDEEKKDPGGTPDSIEDGRSKPITPNSDTDGDDETENSKSTPAASPTPAPKQQTSNTSNNSTTTSSTTTTSPRTKSNTHQHTQRTDEKLHLVCLTLNNLSIPHDNKRVMVRERGAKRLIGNLIKVVASGKKEAYLCCIVLMNLSFYEPGLTTIGQFSPITRRSPVAEQDNRGQHNNNKNSNGNGNGNTSNGNGNTDNNNNNNTSSPTNKNKAAKALATTTTVLKRAAVAVVNGGSRKLTPLENPDSLLRVMQDLLSSAERGTSDFQWGFGLLANLCC